MNNLKIQTVQTKTIIKMTSTQIQSILQQSKRSSPLDQTIPVHSTNWNDNTVPRLQEKACGLFNQQVLTDTEIVSETELLHENSNQSTKKTKKFAERLKQANLHINLKKTNSNESDIMDNDLNLDLDDLKLSSFITPETEKLCFSFFQSMPSASLNITAEDVFNASGINESELKELASIQTAELYDSNKINALIANSSLDASITLPEPVELQNTLCLDHVYSSKRKLSLDFDDNSIMSQESFNCDIPTSSKSTESSKKKQRTRGVYRAKDIKTDDDFQNYLERRKKNNISSKISRSNKKSYYNAMDAKSDELEKDNDFLRLKISKLENLTKELKSYLLGHIKTT